MGNLVKQQIIAGQHRHGRKSKMMKAIPPPPEFGKFSSFCSFQPLFSNLESLTPLSDQRSLYLKAGADKGNF